MHLLSSQATIVDEAQAAQHGYVIEGPVAFLYELGNTTAILGELPPV